MSFLIELASNKAKARAAAKELSISQLENLMAGFSNALDKMHEEQAAIAAENAAKAEQADKISKLIADSGLTLEEIKNLTNLKPNLSKGKTVEPKYRLEKDGQIHEWTGRGRTPRVFQEYFDSGNSRKSVEI